MPQNPFLLRQLEIIGELPVESLIVGKFPFADVRRYGSLNAAVNAIGPTQLKTIIVSTQTYLESDLTIPSNIHLQIFRGGRIYLGNYDLTINGPFSAPFARVFYQTGTGKVVGLFAPKIYPEWWGANGVTDDTTEVQAAINAAKAKDTLSFLGETTYLVSQITVDKPLTLLFNQSTLKAKSDQPVGGLLHITSGDVFIYDLVVDGNSSEVTGGSDRRGIQIHTESGTIDNFLLSNVKIDDIAGTGLYINRVTNLTALKLKVTNAGQKTDQVVTHPYRAGIYVTSNPGNADLTFLDCKASLNGGCGFYFDNPSTRIKVIGGRALSNGHIGLAGCGATWVELIGFVANLNTDNGIDFGSAGGQFVTIRGCITNGNGDAVTNAGLFVGDYHEGDVIIENHQAKDNAGTGILLSFISSTKRVSCFNSVSGRNARDGFALSKVEDSQFRGNYAYDDQGTPTQRYSYFFSNVVNLAVEGNEHDGNADTADFYLGGTNSFLGDIGKKKETLTAASVILHPWGASTFDTTNNAIAGTLGSGQYIGQRKSMVLTTRPGINNAVITITNHAAGDAGTYTFDEVDEAVVLEWMGTEWIEIKNQGATWAGP